MKLILIFLLLLGCATRPSPMTSGYLSEEPFPKKITIVIDNLSDFSTNLTVRQIVTQLSSALGRLQIEVVPMSRVDEFFFKMNILDATVANPIHTKLLLEKLGIEGILVGDIWGVSDQMWVDSRLNLRLYDTRTDMVSWSATAYDPRMAGFDMTISTSIYETTNAMIRLIMSDLANARKTPKISRKRNTLYQGDCFRADHPIIAENPGLSWDSRTQSGGFTFFPGKGIGTTLEEAIVIAERMALDSLKKECGYIHRDTQFNERCDQQDGKVFYSFVRASIGQIKCKTIRDANTSKRKELQHPTLR